MRFWNLVEKDELSDDEKEEIVDILKDASSMSFMHKTSALQRNGHIDLLSASKKMREKKQHRKGVKA